MEDESTLSLHETELPLLIVALRSVAEQSFDPSVRSEANAIRFEYVRLLTGSDSAERESRLAQLREKAAQLLRDFSSPKKRPRSAGRS